MQKSKRSNKNYKPFIAFIVFLGIFGIFALLITRPSTLSLAITELQSSNNEEDVKQLWYKYKKTLSGNNEFLSAVRHKFASFNLSEKQLNDCKQLLPEAPEYLNVIVIPDLSRRIIDTVNNPEQVTNDTVLLDWIWKTFEQAVKLKMNSKDRLMVDVTDNEQAAGKFRKIANRLIFDLSEHHDQSNRLYFEIRGTKFQENISDLYSLARQQPLGADYWFYFDRIIDRNLKKSNIYEDYRNIIFIITDGYLESEDHSYTGNAVLNKNICNEEKTGKSLDEIFKSKKLHIPRVKTDLSNAEVVVLEVNERKSGNKCDFEILKKYWMDWFNSMHIKNADDNYFIARQDATDLTKKEIERIFSR